MRVMVTLETWMRVHGVSIEAMADLIGVSRMTVYRWIRGSNRPTWDALQRISKVTGGQVTADSFLSRAA